MRAGHIGEKDKGGVGFQGSVTHPSSSSVFSCFEYRVEGIRDEFINGRTGSSNQ